MEASHEQGKVFVGGISWETSEGSLTDYFSNFGQVSETVIMRDRTTGRARGFGFVGFSDPGVVDRVLQEKHTIDGRQVELKKALPREEQHQRNPQMSGRNAGTGNQRTKKIFVGGLASTVTEDDFRKHFEQYGTVTDVVVMYDHGSQRPRGFGFISYDSEDVVERVVAKNFHELHGKMVEVKRAMPKENSPGVARSRSSPMPYGGPQNNRYGGQGGAHGGRGGYAAPPYAGPPAPVAGYYGGYVAGGAYPVAGPGGPPHPHYAGAAFAGAYGPTGYVSSPSPYGAAGAAPGAYVAAPIAGNYPNAGAAPWPAPASVGQAAAVGGGYGYGSGVESGYGGGYGGSSGTGAYVAPVSGGAPPGGYQGPSGEMYGVQGYGDSHKAAPSGNGSGTSPVNGYGMGPPIQNAHSANGSAGYGASGRQSQKVSDTRFRPYPASADRAN